MERSSFFNSIGGDRRYRAEDWTSYFGSFIGNGVFPDPTDTLQVVAGDGMNVIVRPGKAWINGYFYANDSDLVLRLPNADGVLGHVHRVVLRWDLTERTITGQFKSAIPDLAPAPPSLQRDADIYELGLADVMVGAGVVGITQANITDHRLNAELCGIVSGVVDQIDASSFTAQFTAQFEEWFAGIQTTLDGDTVGSLLNQINERIPMSDFATEQEALDGVAADKVMSPARVSNVLENSGGTLNVNGRKVRGVNNEHSLIYTIPTTFVERIVSPPAIPIALSPSGRFLISGTGSASVASVMSVYDFHRGFEVYNLPGTFATAASTFCGFGETFAGTHPELLLFRGSGANTYHVYNATQNRGVDISASAIESGARFLGIRNGIAYIINNGTSWASGNTRNIRGYDIEQNAIHAPASRSISTPAGTSTWIGYKNGFGHLLNVNGQTWSMMIFDAETGSMTSHGLAGYASPTTPAILIHLWNPQTREVVWSSRVSNGSQNRSFWRYNFNTHSLTCLADNVDTFGTGNINYQGHLRGTSDLFFSGNSRLFRVTDTGNSFVFTNQASTISFPSVVPQSAQYLIDRFRPNGSTLIDLVNNRTHMLMYSSGQTPLQGMTTTPGWSTILGHAAGGWYSMSNTENGTVWFSTLSHSGTTWNFLRWNYNDLFVLESVKEV